MENMIADYSAVANVISAFALRNVSMSAQKTTTVTTVLLTIYYYLPKAS